jgi:hypothetical protein
MTVPSVENAGRLLTAEQVVERWQVPRSQVYRLARTGGYRRSRSAATTASARPPSTSGSSAAAAAECSEANHDRADHAR